MTSHVASCEPSSEVTVILEVPNLMALIITDCPLLVTVAMDVSELRTEKFLLDALLGDTVTVKVPDEPS